MKKIIAEVYEEDDYNVFRRLPDNRDVYASRVNKLIASITEKYILNPIIVNEKMEVIDGQGRFEARKEMGLPIHYIIAYGATSEDCSRMNRYNTVWKALDFAKSYAKKGVEAYIILLRTCEETSKSITTILRLGNHAGDKDLYEKGRLHFENQDAEAAKNAIRLSTDILNALQFHGRVNEAFMTGVKVMVETTGYVHAKMVRNCEKSRTTYNQMANLEAQLKEFERIYNKGARVQDKLYFSDYMRNKGANVREYKKTYSEYEDNDTSSLREA